MRLIRICFQTSLALLINAGVVYAEDGAKDVPVGMLLPLSGNYAAVGADNRQGIEAALELSPHKVPLKIVYEDSKADPVTSVQGFNKLLEEKVLAVYAMRGPVGMAINPISKARGVPILGGVGNKDFAAANDFAYQLWSKSDVEGKFLARQFEAQHFKKVAILTAQDDWPVAVSNGFRDGLKGAAVNIVYDQEFVPGDTDFLTALAQIRSKSADVVFVNLAIGQLGVFFKQAHAQNLTAAYYSNFWIAKKDVIQAAEASNVEGVKYIEMSTALPTLGKFVETKFNASPSAATLSSYLGTLLLIQTLSQNPEISTSASFNAALSRQKEVQTPDGNFKIESRCVQFPLVERTLHDGVAK